MVAEGKFDPDVRDLVPLDEAAHALGELVRLAVVRLAVVGLAFVRLAV